MYITQNIDTFNSVKYDLVIMKLLKVEYYTTREKRTHSHICSFITKCNDLYTCKFYPASNYIHNGSVYSELY